MLKRFFLQRLKEPSTWRGIILMLTTFGVAIEPTQKEAIITAGLGIVGVLGAFLPDAKKE
jgi:hypothetical protein